MPTIPMPITGTGIESVIPARAGIQSFNAQALDSRLRGYRYLVAIPLGSAMPRLAITSRRRSG